MSALLSTVKKHVKTIKSNKAERWGHIILKPGQAIDDVPDDEEIDYMVVIQTYEQEPSNNA